jgi:hypothetical protein
MSKDIIARLMALSAQIRTIGTDAPSAGKRANAIADKLEDITGTIILESIEQGTITIKDEVRS